MTIRSRKRILLEAENKLGETVRSFLQSVPPKSTPAYAKEMYEQHDARWQMYCRKMQQRHKWIKMDASAFQTRVLLINSQAERKLQPVRYYAKRVLPLLLLAIIIWAITDLLLPQFGITQYQLF